MAVRAVAVALELGGHPRPRPDRKVVLDRAVRSTVPREDVVWPVAENAREDRRADERHQEQEDDEDAACNRGLVPAETAPDLLPVAAGTYLDLAELGAGLDRDRPRQPCAGRDNLALLISSHR